MKLILTAFINVTAIFGILILIVWPIGHFLCESIKINLSDIGACLGGIAAVIGLYSGLLKFFESKDRRNSNLRRSEVINIMMSLRNSLDALYTVSNPFALTSDPEQKDGQDYPEYMKTVRAQRYEKFKETIEKLKSDSNKVDALFNKEIVNLFNDIYYKWLSIEQHFFLWQASYDLKTKSYNKRVDDYFKESKLSSEDYDSFKSRISEIIKKINHNYDKETEDMSFE